MRLATDRLTAMGYGETRSVADHHPAEGHDQNGRVEMHLFLSHEFFLTSA